MKMVLFLSLFYFVYSLELKDEYRQLKEENAFMKVGLQALENRLSDLEQKCDRSQYKGTSSISINIYQIIATNHAKLLKK